jgi:50S ribosomal subunit-associated GTPase HflX
MSRRRTVPPCRVLADADVVLVGLFSAKDAEYETKLDLLAALVETHGGRIVSRHIQRRGVSHGGAHQMTAPFSRRTLISPGKAREVADGRRAAKADAVVFVNPLTEHQQAVLGDILGCPVISGENLCNHLR